MVHRVTMLNLELVYHLVQQKAKNVGLSAARLIRDIDHSIALPQRAGRTYTARIFLGLHSYLASTQLTIKNFPIEPVPPVAE
jgi:3-hydroxy-3-methylglutaryl CoA synthase